MRSLFYQSSMSGNLWRVIKFCCVGILNTVVAFFIFLFLKNINIYLAFAISWSGACLFSYVLNKIWTFRATDTGLMPFIRFVIINICSMGLGIALMHFFISLGSGEIWSWILSLPIAMTTSYLGYSLWCFKQNQTLS